MTEAGWTRHEDAAEAYADKAAIEAIWHVRGAHKLTCDEHENLQQDFKDVAQEAYRQGRVDCLGDVKRYVERQIKMGEDFIGGPDPNIQRRVALDEVIEYCDRQLAQQAQDEKGVGDAKV